MSTRAFGIGIESFSKKLVDWIGDTIKAMQIDLTAADTQVKLITGCTIANPAVFTATAHGGVNGDLVVVRGVGGMPEVCQTGKLAGVTTNTFTLQTLDGLNVQGTGTYTSGGSFINLTQTAVLGDINAGRVGTDQTLGSKTDVGGLLNCAAMTFSGVSSRVDGLIIYKDSGSDATSVPLFFIDGKMIVRVAADALISATTLWAERLLGALAAGTVFNMSVGGVAVTSSPGAAQFARSITCNALSAAVAAGHQADVATTGAGLPFTGGGGAYTYTPDTAANKLFNLNAI